MVSMLSLKCTANALGCSVKGNCLLPGRIAPSNRKRVLVQKQASHLYVGKHRLTIRSSVTSSGALQSAMFAGAAPVALQTVTCLVAVSTVYAVLLYSLVILLPKWRQAQRMVQSNWALVPLAVIYGIVLAISWSPDQLSLMMPGSLQEGLSGGFKPQFFPQLEDIQTLFSRPLTFASFWIHLLFINLFFARSCYLEGLKMRIPTLHSVLLSICTGPLGVLSHYLTKASYDLIKQATGRDMRPREQAVSLKSNDGYITIMPYNNN